VVDVANAVGSPATYGVALATCLAWSSLKRAPVPETSTARQKAEESRGFLQATQLADGGWPATTRPSDGWSYAQQISATSWATLALLATR
jgi:hypothetical protein